MTGGWLAAKSFRGNRRNGSIAAEQELKRDKYMYSKPHVMKQDYIWFHLSTKTCSVIPSKGSAYACVCITDCFLLSMIWVTRKIQMASCNKVNALGILCTSIYLSGIFS